MIFAAGAKHGLSNNCPKCLARRATMDSQICTVHCVMHHFWHWNNISNTNFMRCFSVSFARQACGEFLHSGLSAWYLLHLCGVYRWKYQIDRWSFYWSCTRCPIVHGYNFVANYIYQLGKISLLFSQKNTFRNNCLCFFSPLKGAEFEIFGAIFVVSQFYNSCVICNTLLLHVPWADYIGT